MSDECVLNISRKGAKERNEYKRIARFASLAPLREFSAYPLTIHHSPFPNFETPGSPSIRKILHQEFRCPLCRRRGSEYLHGDRVNSLSHCVQWGVNAPVQDSL